MQKLFSYEFSQNIWRIMPDQDPDSNLWAIELRSGADKKVSFAMIDLGVSLVKWQVSPEATDWWTSLTAFSYGKVYLHNYRYPDIPEPTDLLMLDVQSGELQWVIPNYVLVQSLNEHYIEVATKVGEQFQYRYCKAESGILANDLVWDKHEADQIILREPVRYKEEDAYFEQMASFIKNHTGGHVPVAIDYMEKRPYIMFSYYIYDIEKITQYLLIVTDKRDIVLLEKLSEGREGIGQSTMLLRGDSLVYLKNNKEFTGLTLL